MLLNLHVKNLALIQELEIDFSKGLNILTGETGAGKSILIGSIELALGGKVHKEFLREGTTESLAELVFSVSESQAKEFQEMGYTIEDQEVILSRKIQGSRSINKINGETVPLSRLREAAQYLIDIHGQHEHQSLLKKQKQLELLDDFAGEELEDLKKRLKAAYEIYCKLKKEIEENSLDEETRSRELDFLRFEIQEIQEAALIPGEDRLLEEEYQKLSHGRKILEAVTEAHTLCGYEEAQAGEKIGHALKALAGVCSYDEKLGEFSIQLETIDSLLNDVARELWNYEQDFDYSEQRLHETEQRLNQINQLKMKYGADIEKILKAKEEKEARAEQLENYESYLQDKKAQYEKQQEQVEMFCCKISEIRRKKAGEFSQKVSTHLADLNFQDVRFQVALKQMDTYTDNGFDEPEYEIAFNVGESLKPLAKVASGGEMSRVMLALKTVLADQDEIQTVIFDEIDTGISGRTAQKVSEKMALIAKNRQVICITHLPQIASMADAHYFIEKSIEQTTTKTSIRKLEEEEMVMELARILGGVEITEKVIENAKDMKKQADQWKDHS